MARYPGSRRKISTNKRRMRKGGRTSARKPYQAGGRTSVGGNQPLSPEPQCHGTCIYGGMGPGGGQTITRPCSSFSGCTCPGSYAGMMLSNSTCQSAGGTGTVQGGYGYPGTGVITGSSSAMGGYDPYPQDQLMGQGQRCLSMYDCPGTQVCINGWCGYKMAPVIVTRRGGKVRKFQQGGNTNCGPGMMYSNGGCVPSNGTRYKSGGKTGTKEFSRGVKPNRRK